MKKMVTGKLYEIIHELGLECVVEAGAGLGDYATRMHYPAGTIFLYVGQVRPFEFSGRLGKGPEDQPRKFSKILIDDKILLTYHEYLLEDIVVEAKSNG